MEYNGYHFFIGNLELPYAPSELKLKVGSQNQTITLIDGSEYNILRSPKLTEIEFEIELPRGRQYPFANKLVSPKTFTDYFEKLKVKRSVVSLIITRPNPEMWNFRRRTLSTKDFESNKLSVTLEDYTLTESADNAFDVKVSLKFKQYVWKHTVTDSSRITYVKVDPPPKEVTENKKYVVKKGDTLWGIARQYYGDGSKWKKIYDTNKTIIENTARKYGKYSSSNGHWIYPGTKLIIPITTYK